MIWDPLEILSPIESRTSWHPLIQNRTVPESPQFYCYCGELLNVVFVVGGDAGVMASCKSADCQVEGQGKLLGLSSARWRCSTWSGCKAGSSRMNYDLWELLVTQLAANRRRQTNVVGLKAI